MVFIVEFPVSSFTGKTDFVITYNKCSVGCDKCNLKLNGKGIKYNNVLGELKAVAPFIDNIIITGGEPLEYKNVNKLIKDINKLINENSNRNVKIHLYTSGVKTKKFFKLPFDLLDKIYIDYKGNSVNEIIENTKLDKVEATELLSLYHKVSKFNKVVFRSSTIVDDFIKNEIVYYDEV